MFVVTLAFYLFATVTIGSALMVISARNPVHSVLFLILAFFSAAALFVLMGAEFLAMILVVVYVGAVAVLFLFVVMMLDIDFRELKQGFLQYLPLGALIGVVLAVELIFVIGSVALISDADALAQGEALPVDQSNIEALGRVLYTQYLFLFQSAGLVLLVAMIGAIVLTLRHRVGVRRQKIADQVSRRPEDVVVKARPGVGEGV
ncbi:MAG: NADH-quinone oxidoreductase subunit J [Rhodospirillaceae bacterium]|nr:NADH-quinone oxidoreductase subunit J [Rhodospirillaceae bacterium]MCA8933000.1 NADH-quinone oxidoreductase subunit J [Rhodospirillaceae bacterium]